MAVELQSICNTKVLCKNVYCIECFERSFASHSKSKYWSDMNKINPRDVFKSSKNKHVFNCDKCNHKFERALYNVNQEKNHCPYCATPTTILCNNNDCHECFDRSFASHPKSTYWSDGNKMKPRDVFKSSKNKYIFNCDTCNHEFEKLLDAIEIEKHHCPYCAVPSKLLCNKEDCNECFKRSFASHPKSKFIKEKNARQILKYSLQKNNFICDICTHEFTKSISSISVGQWCHYCSNIKLCNNDDCIQCFKKSFASHPKSKYWSDTNNINPRQVFKGCPNKYIFNCDTCNHIFERKISEITEKQHCLYCVIPSKILCTNNDCVECFNRSFASHEKSKYWNDTNITPRQVFKYSSNKYTFICEQAHLFVSALDSLTYKKSWCPHCINKTEQKLYESLSLLYTISRQFKTEWCKKIKCLPFDFVIKDKNIIIELDGPQHFKQISNWSSEIYQQENDIYKMKCANNNGFSVIRIIQEDVYYDKYDWLSELDITVKKIVESNIVQNIFLCKNNEYNTLCKINNIN